MNNLRARGPTVINDIVASDQSPRPWQEAAAECLKHEEPGRPICLWLSCESGKSWALRYMKELFKKDWTVYELHMGNLHGLEHIPENIPENTLVLIDDFDSARMRVEDWGLLKKLCTQARVVVAAQQDCPDIDGIQGRFVNFAISSMLDSLLD